MQFTTFSERQSTEMVILLNVATADQKTEIIQCM